MATTSFLTIDDFERLPDEHAKNHELIDGELVDVSERTLGHNALRDLLMQTLTNAVREGRLGRVISEQDYDFGGNAHGPDVSFFSAAKAPLIAWNKRVQPFVPDLAIEIVSENDTFRSLMQKRQRYLDCGTREVWIIAPDTREIYIYAEIYAERRNRILRENDVLRTDQIPGFSITVSELFQRL